jgi:hypothetical protein
MAAVMMPAIGMTSASADVAAQPIEQKASAKAATREKVRRRRNWLRRERLAVAQHCVIAGNGGE